MPDVRGHARHQADAMKTWLTLTLTSALLATAVVLPTSPALARPSPAHPSAVRRSPAAPSSANPSSTSSSPADDIPAFTFDDCPAIPAGADPTAWRCEEMHATGTVRLGAVELPVTLKTTHAEGRPAGATTTEFIFGDLRSEPVPVPGGLRGTPRSSAELTLQYAGHIDFVAGPPMAEILHLKYHVTARSAGRHCSIGTDADPLIVVGEIVGERVPVQQNPQVLKFAVEDNDFAVPSAHGCGPAGRLVDRRFDLPSTGSLQLTVYFSIRTYDTL